MLIPTSHSSYHSLHYQPTKANQKLLLPTYQSQTKPQTTKVAIGLTTKLTTNLTTTPKMKLHLLTPLLLLLLSATSSVLADKTILYTCTYPRDGSGKHSVNESKSGDPVSDDFAEKFIRSMRAWSDQRYQAKSDEIGGVYVVVVCRFKAESKEQALEAIGEQERIVGEHIRDG